MAHGLSDNLITRAADVMLKERRRLVLMVRESPLHLTHLRNMVSVTEMGGIICPPVPAFYLRPQSIGDIVDHSVARALDLLDVPHNLREALARPGIGRSSLTAGIRARTRTRINPVLAGPVMAGAKRDQGRALSEPQASLRETPALPGSAGCPKRSEGTRTAGRLSFAYFSLAKQRKVSRPPGRKPGPGTQISQPFTTKTIATSA